VKTIIVLIFMFQLMSGLYPGSALTDEATVPKAPDTITVVIEAENVLGESVVKPVKYYLPEEVGPRHIRGAEGFRVIKDAEKGRFCLVRDVSFAPRETRRFYVTVEDVWVIPGNTIEGYVREAEGIRAALADTGFAEIAGTLADTVKKEAGVITASQAKAESIQGHIATFRRNGERMAVIGETLDRLRELRSGMRGRASRGMDSETVRSIMFMVVTFLVLFTAVSYVVWSINLRKSEMRGTGREKTGQGK